MHELSIVQNILTIAADHAGNRRVHRIKLRIGKLTAVVPEALRFCFDACAQETLAEGAILDIDETEGDELHITELEVDDV